MPLDELFEFVQESVLGSGTNDASLLHPVFEQDQGRDAHHVVGPSGLRVVIDVQLAYVETVLFLGKLFENGGDDTAGATPLGPEVDEYRLLTAYGVVETRLVQCLDL